MVLVTNPGGGWAYEKVKAFRILLLTFVLLLGISNSAFALGFNLLNDSGKHIIGFYATPVNSNNWNNNMVYPNGLRYGVTIGVNLGANARYWKLKAVFSDGHINVCNSVDMSVCKKVIVRYDNWTLTRG